MLLKVGSKSLVEVKADRVYWECCTCSGKGSARVNNWNSPRSRTCCGGRFYKNRDRLLIVWHDMNARCLDPQHPAYARYNHFGRPGWKSKEDFFYWAEKNNWQYGLELDRIDNSLGYQPSNCRFVSRTQNARNRKNNRIISAFGQSKTAMEWSQDPRCKVQAQSILARIDRYGWDSESAIVGENRHGI